MKSNPWAFAIVFLFLAGYLMWNNFSLPVFYPFEETKNVKGYVYQTEFVRPHLPRGLDQSVYYFYSVNNKTYVKEERLNKRQNLCNIGDSLQIEYSTKDPSRSKMLQNITVKKLPIYNTKYKKHFSVVKENGYKEISLNANIFTYADYENYGKLILKVSGKFKKVNDTLKLMPIIHHKFDKTKYRSEHLLPINNKIKISDFLLENNGEVVVELNSGLQLK